MTTTSFNFPRADVEALVQITNQDEENKLDLFCYTHCDNNDTEFLKQCRGLIYSGDSLISRGFSYSDEFASIDETSLEKTLTPLANFSFFHAYEGTILRFFYHNNRWFMSTHRKINAERSRWSGNKSFSKLFEEALIHQQVLSLPTSQGSALGCEPSGFLPNVTQNHIQEFQKLLSTSRQYLFLIRARGDNCIGNREPLETEPYFFHIASIENHGNHEFLQNYKESFPIVEQLNFSTIKDLADYVSQCDYTAIQGVVCFDGRRHVKVLNKNYMDVVELRGNEPSIPFRYLQVKEIKSMREALQKQYPSHVEKFRQYDSILFKYAVKVHNSYLQRYIKREPCIFEPQIHFILCNCHKWHQENKTRNIVTLEVVLREVSKLQPHQLNYIIKAELNPKENKENKDNVSTVEAASPSSGGSPSSPSGIVAPPGGPSVVTNSS